MTSIEICLQTISGTDFQNLLFFYNFLAYQEISRGMVVKRPHTLLSSCMTHETPSRRCQCSTTGEILTTRTLPFRPAPSVRDATGHLK